MMGCHTRLPYDSGIPVQFEDTVQRYDGEEVACAVELDMIPATQEGWRAVFWVGLLCWVAPCVCGIPRFVDQRGVWNGIRRRRREEKVPDRSLATHVRADRRCSM